MCMFCCISAHGCFMKVYVSKLFFARQENAFQADDSITWRMRIKYLGINAPNLNAFSIFTSCCGQWTHHAQLLLTIVLPQWSAKTVRVNIVFQARARAPCIPAAMSRAPSLLDSLPPASRPTKPTFSFFWSACGPGNTPPFRDFCTITRRSAATCRPMAGPRTELRAGAETRGASLLRSRGGDERRGEKAGGDETLRRKTVAVRTSGRSPLFYLISSIIQWDWRHGGFLANERSLFYQIVQPAHLWSWLTVTTVTGSLRTVTMASKGGGGVKDQQDAVRDQEEGQTDKQTLFI